MNDSTAETRALATTETGLTDTAAELIPFQHHGEWLKLTAPEMERIKELLAAMSAIERDGRPVVKVCAEIALANRGRRGWSKGNLRNLYYLWIEKRDWRLLRREYRHESALPAEFIMLLQRLVLKEHRSRKQAIHKIRELWREGKTVDGYGTWRQWFAVTYPDREVPAHFSGDYPAGWSDSNFYLHMPSRAQHTLATKGRHAAHGELPSIARDPSALRFMECIVIDDFETDVMACAGREIVRLRGLVAQDVATRTKLASGLKPRVEGDDGQRISITRQDVQFLIKQIFARWGVPANYPVTIYVENSSAAVTAELEAALDLYFHGQVRICRMDMLSYKTAANGFVEKGGKPGLHGWIESGFNLMHNRAGALPGQKGSRYDNAPGDLDAKLKYCRQLFAYECGDETLAQYRIPFLTVDQAVITYDDVFEWMDALPGRKLLGFDQVTEWRLGPGDAPKPFEALALLTPEEQKKVEILPARTESPIERRAKLTRDVRFVKVPEPVLALLAFTAKPATVKNHHVTFRHLGKGYTFANAGSAVLRERNGTEVLAYFDERTMECIHCFTREGAYLGELRRLGGTSIKDLDGIAAAAKQLAQLFHSEIEGPVRELLAGERAQAEADRAHNDELLVRAGHQPISAPERRAVTPGDEGGEAPKPGRLARPSLTATLARDAFEPPVHRFAAPMHTAATIADATALQIAEARRNRPSATPAGELSELAPAAPQKMAPVTNDEPPTDASSLSELMD